MDTLIIPDKKALFGGFFLIGLSGFGGVLPQAQHQLVQRRRWLNDAEFAELLALGQILPGPNIVNMAVAIGSRFHGARGALLAVAGLLLAPLVLILLLATLYQHYQQAAWLQQLLAGLAPAGIGLLLGMVLKLAARLPRRGLPWALALLTFAAVAALQLPLWLVLLVLAPLAVGLAWRWPQPGA